MAGSILIADDDPVQRRLAEAALTRGGFTVRTVESGTAALKLLEESSAPFSLLVLDLVMPGGPDGLAVLEALRGRDKPLPVIVQTAQGSIDTVVAAMRAGAFDFVVKPASPEKLCAAVSRALKVEAVEGEARRQAARKTASPSLKDFSSASPALAHVLRLGEKAAASNIPVLIEGESGTGKEVLARAIQAASARRGKPFVTVNCGAIPENLVESILFGHEKGAFTGATEKHAGKFVEAHGGTLFLDEVGDLPLDTQVKLLRAVQEGEVDPVGGRSSVHVDIRLISATHRDLAERVREGKFREDLYYRLNVFPIRLPPLRERKSDIPALVRVFIGRAAAAHPSGRAKGISRAALALLQAYDWPGNIRQLENAVFRACVLCEGDTLGAEEFPQIDAQVSGAVALERRDEPAVVPAAPSSPQPEAAAPEAPVDAASADAAGIVRALDERGNVRALADVEFDMIRLAIDHYGGQMSEVARRLGIGRSTLYRKLKEYGLCPDEERAEDGEATRLAS